MTVQSIPGVGGCVIPPFWTAVQDTSANQAAAASIAASAAKMAFVGRYTKKDRSSTSPIRKVHFLPGAVTAGTGTNTIQVSLQDVSLTASPLQPDAVADQTVSFALSTVTANTWFTTAALSADRTIAVGDYLAVVWEYAAFGTGPSLQLSTLAPADHALSRTGNVMVASTGSNWAVLSRGWPNVIFECADGTFGTLDTSFQFSALSTIAFNSGSAANEIALAFSFPGPVTLDAIGIDMSVAGNSSDYQGVLYTGTTATATVSQDANAITSTSEGIHWLQFASPIALAANTTYRAALKPTTVNNVTLRYLTVSAAGHLDTMPGGQGFYYSTRNGGAWTDTLTRRPAIYLRILGIDDGASAGGVPRIGSSMIRRVA